MNKLIITIIGILLCCLLSPSSQAQRIKDIARMDGVRTNQLVGYGLVVGLDGTGDQVNSAPFTGQSFQSMLNQFGIRLPPGAGANLQLKNVAAVAVSAHLPAFVKQGQTIDVTVSSIGNAKSLRGGHLLMTPLQAADGQVYAISQGNLIVSGIGASGSDGSKVTINIPSSGLIPNGATVEKTVMAPYLKNGAIIYNLNRPDFTTAQRMADAINEKAQKNIAFPLDASSVKIVIPHHAEKFTYAGQAVAFISEVENINLDPAEAAAKIIINSRTGTIVIGQNVRVLPAAVSHGNLTVTITESTAISQPGPLSGGTTAAVPSSDIKVAEQKNRAFVFKPGTTLKELVHAINKVGAAPGDLVSILEALKAAGAVDAEIEVI